MSRIFRVPTVSTTQSHFSALCALWGECRPDVTCSKVAVCVVRWQCVYVLYITSLRTKVKVRATHHRNDKRDKRGWGSRKPALRDVKASTVIASTARIICGTSVPLAVAP